MAEDLSKSFAQEEDLSQSFANEPSIGGSASSSLEAKLQNALMSVGEGAEDTSRAFLDSVLLGGSGELLGGMQAGSEKLQAALTGKQAQDFLELYKKYHKEQEDALKLAEQRSPTLTGIGTAAGIVLPALATAGAGLAAGGTKAAIQTAAKGGAKEMGKLMLKGAGTGALLGATQGALSSEGTLADNPDQVLSDALSGGKAGAIVGGALPLVSVPIAKGYNWVKGKAEGYAERSPLVRQAIKAFEKGKAGEIIEESDVYRTATGLRESQDIKALTSKILDADEALGDRKSVV